MLRAATGVGVAATAFAGLAGEDAADDDTTQHRMLEASRDEIDRPSSLAGVLRVWIVWVWEPLRTGVRFLHLVTIFVPVILAAPAVVLGRRLPERDNERQGALWWYGFLVRAMEAAGPAFIKLGQWAASRTDIFPAEMCDIMSRLHSRAPAHSLQATRRIVERAFGRPFGDVFDEFDPEPLGVGAIAQVYRARLKADLAVVDADDVSLTDSVRKNVHSVLKHSPRQVPSSFVAVKVLHPGVDRTVCRDLHIMHFFARALNAVPTMEWLSLPDEVAKFGEMMLTQLDLRIEATNLDRFRRNFKHRRTVSFPDAHEELTHRGVLIEEFAHGIPLSHFLEKGGGVFRREIANEGLDAFLRMLLIDNFVHADLHPGNIMVRFFPRDSPFGSAEADDVEQVLSRLRRLRRPRGDEWTDELARIDAEGYRPQLIFIDTGLVTELSETNRSNFLDLFRAIASFDGYRAGNLMCERCRQPDAVIDKELFALKMQDLVLKVKRRTLSLGSVRVGDILQDVFSMVRNHHVRLEGDFVNVIISILLLEGIGRHLDPDLDLLSSSLPILRQLGAQQLGAQSGKGVVQDLSLLRVWVGLETRLLLQATIEDVERCVKYDLLSPNV